MINQWTVDQLTFTKFSDLRLPDMIMDIIEVQGDDVPTSKRLFPRNAPEILINLAGPIYGELGNKTGTIEDCSLQGSKTSYLDVLHPPYCHFLSIRFSPNGLYKLLGIPQKEFTDHLFRLEEVLDGELCPLISKLKEAPNVQNRFQILTNWLSRLEIGQGKNEFLISDLIIHFLKKEPGISVRQLAEKAGFSRKHLHFNFKEETGLAIKEYQKINRMYLVLKEMKNKDFNSWAQLACKYGYYDQSHFIKDIKQYTGLLPTHFMHFQSP